MGKISRTLLVVCAVDLLATTGDISFSWTSPIYPKLYSNDSTINPLGRPITPDEDTWLGSLLNFGAIIGSPFFGYISAAFGRKPALLCIALPHVISYVTMAFARNINLFLLARFVSGIAVGGGYTMLATYIGEIAEDSSRGGMSLTLNVFWAIGNFIPYAIGPFLSVFMFNSILALIPIVFLVIFTLFCPETPYYLVGVKKFREAEKALMLLRSADADAVEEELTRIKIYMKSNEDGHFLDIVKSATLRKCFMICFVLIATQELSGFSVITYHLQSIFAATDSAVQPHISALIVGFVMLVSSFIAPFLVDRSGRRNLVIWSCIGTCLSLTTLGTFFYIQDVLKAEPIFWIPIVSLISYIVSFNLGICTVPWTLTAELFPSNVKQVAASSISICSWMVSFVTTNTFNDMTETLGRSGTFWCFAILSFCSTIFAFVFVPETKGKSFMEIQEKLLPGVRETVDDKNSELLVKGGQNGGGIFENGTDVEKLSSSII
ncbi:unnamed protein product [Phaedon cochleariae]|uniref:Major facilitator superfamily (MFS) profile domain-containing protein n=1 Tax=Phaedon cochleariae TaxID=80249 RepID=A0A9P0DLE8_PHACE|nr:unnamed protein product [Phaedon cochleariae]